MSDDPLDILLDNAEAQIRVVEVVVILTDLIAELRPCQLPPRASDALHRAEAQLREVQGER